MRSINTILAASIAALLICNVANAKDLNADDTDFTDAYISRNAEAHYSGYDDMFRHKDHEGYNPHYRKCGYFPGGSCN